jgi:hypothetical protein
MNKTHTRSRRRPLDFDLESLLHPALAFKHPQHVVSDPDLTLNEKRAILASWASDACAIEAAPDLRQVPGSTQPVRYDDVMDALRALDRQASEHYCAPPRYPNCQTGCPCGFRFHATSPLTRHMLADRDSSERVP